jgi:hypothetical protein
VAVFRGFKPAINLGSPKEFNAAYGECKPGGGAAAARAAEKPANRALQPNANNLILFPQQILYLRRSKQKMNAFV